MDLRAVQKPLKDAYRQDAGAAQVTLSARGSAADVPVSCSVDLGRTIRRTPASAGPGRPRARAICCSARSPRARS